MYTGWVEVTLTSRKTRSLCKSLWTWFWLYDVHKVYSFYGGTPIEEYRKQFVGWNQHSNGWLELAIKTTKRVFAHNADSCGGINVQFLISWPNATLPARILAYLLLLSFTVVLSRNTSLSYGTNARYVISGDKINRETVMSKRRMRKELF